MANTTPDMPTTKDLEDAHEIYLENEPRDLFYHAASELVRLSRTNATDINLAEALAVLLLTWNQSFYRFHPDLYSEEHFKDIEGLLEAHEATIAKFGRGSIFTLRDEDRETVQTIFTAFRKILRPTGAAKALHLLAPTFFPIWDFAIRQAYGKRGGVPYADRGEAPGYWAFMKATRRQYENVEPEWRLDVGILKALDDYNYCKYKLHVI